MPIQAETGFQHEKQRKDKYADAKLPKSKDCRLATFTLTVGKDGKVSKKAFGKIKE